MVANRLLPEIRDGEGCADRRVLPQNRSDHIQRVHAVRQQRCIERVAPAHVRAVRSSGVNLANIGPALPVSDRLRRAAIHRD